MSMGQKHSYSMAGMPPLITPTQDQIAAAIAHAIPGGGDLPPSLPPPSSAAPPAPLPQRKPPVPISNGQLGIGESEPDFKRGGTPRFDSGGAPNSSEMDPWYTRSEARNMVHPEGLISSQGAGRTDIHNINVPAGSYIVPADVASGLAEGNTLAGAGVMDRIMHSNPWGIQGGRAHGSMGPPHSRAPAPLSQAAGFKKGGKTASQQQHHIVPIVVAGGELLYYPETIAKKFGDLKKGHAALDAFVRKVRAKNVKTLSKLPGPKK